MENQHRKITGYRELSQEEIDLMNQIKARGEEMKNLFDGLMRIRQEQGFDLVEGIPCAISSSQLEESFRCMKLAKDHLQTGIMWFVRAVALPQSF